MKLDEGHYSSPRWSYEVLDCAMPMTFDTYSNCAHQCVYCFSFFQRALGITGDDYLHHKVRAVNVEKVKRMFLDPDNHAGQFKNYIKRRLVLQWGGLSDGFDWYEKKFGKSLELLRFFKEIDYPISISTKGVWFLDDPRYIEVLKDAKNTHWKYSIITSNEEHAAKIEPGTPSTAERMLALKKLYDLGVGATTFRFRPFIIGTSEDSIDPLFEQAAKNGCYSVTTEFLGWESRSSNTSRARLDLLSQILGYNVWQFYKDNSAHAAGLLRLNYDLKRPYIERMKAKAEKVGLKFFVSDAHHKESSYHAGCCGLPETGPLSNVNRGQYAHAIKLAKENGFVRWADIAEEAFAVLGDAPFVNGSGLNTASSDERAKREYMTLFDYMHDVWNTPNSWQSPARYFGGALVPSQPDDDGDIVYLYNQPFVENGLRVHSVSELAVQLRLTGKDNANRFDEMTVDGGDNGHVAYPIIVFSRGRSNLGTTIGLLNKARLQNVFVYVPEGELESYQAHYPNTDFLAVHNLDTIAEARTKAAEEFKAEGYPYAWMLDDDIQKFYKPGNDGLLVECSARAVLSGLEAFANVYENISMLGCASEPVNEFEFNTDMLRGLALVNLNTGNVFDWPVYEDYGFILKALEGGFVPVSHGGYSFDKALGLAGGMARQYLRGDAVRACTGLAALYPLLVSVANDMPAPVGSRPLVRWNDIQVSLRSRPVRIYTEDIEALLQPDEELDPGIELGKEGE